MEVVVKQDANGTENKVIIATQRLPKHKVLQMQGKIISVAASLAAPQSQQDLHQILELPVKQEESVGQVKQEEGMGGQVNEAVLDQSDPSAFDITHPTLRADDQRLQNVALEQIGDALYFITVRAVEAGEPLLGFWEWEGNAPLPPGCQAKNHSTFYRCKYDAGSNISDHWLHWLA